MLFRKIYGGSVIYFLLILFFCSCLHDKAAEDPAIRLQWSRSYAAEDWAKVKKGLAWALSFIGASTADGTVDKAFTIGQDGIIYFDPGKAGFNEHAFSAVREMIGILKESDEYKKKGSVDLGRFLVLSIYSPWNYFAITNTETTLGEFKSKYHSGQEVKYVADHSTVSANDRIISFYISHDISKMYFIAEEGTGSVELGTFVPKEYETIVIMPNGQPRFALYDENGRLKSEADTALSVSGKPGKCMWCHESKIQPLFALNNDVPGYLTQQEFMSLVDSANFYLDQYRLQLHAGNIYNHPAEHELSELLYITFMEPAAMRLSSEWKMSEQAVKQLLQALPSHTNSEFSMLGDLYDRRAVDPFAFYQPLPVPSSVREKSDYEPDFFNLSH